MRILKVCTNFCSSLLLLSLFLTGTIVVSCVREDNLRPVHDNDPQAQIELAKQWFEERMYSENYLTAESDMLLYKDWMPDWEKATLHELSGIKTVEVPLLLKKVWISMSDDLLEAYEETKDPKYLLADIKLVIETDPDTGEMNDIIRETTPSLVFLQANDFDPACMDITDEFSGTVKYYTPVWQFLYAYTYENGKITNKLVKADPKTRLGGELVCFNIVLSTQIDWYLNSYEGPYITTTYEYTISVICVYDLGGGGIGGSGLGDGSGGSSGGDGSGGGGSQTGTGVGDGSNNQGPGNFKLTDNKSKEKIPMIVDYLLADCVGRKLVSEIESLNISFVYNQNHPYPASYNQNKTITWESISQFSLFEELFHAYQDKMGYIKQDSSGKITNTKNMEAEAKLALYQYAVKIGATSGLPGSLIIWKNAFDPYIASPTTANYQKMLEFLDTFQLFGYEYANKSELSSARTTNNATAILNCQN